MNFWKRMGGPGDSAEVRPWGATAILNTIDECAGAKEFDQQEWQCAKAPAFVLMFRSRRPGGRGRSSEK